ncbi:MAG: hypothetical protein MJ078_07230, partial [Clostridia bacterium]|nr:hypothetical protein [Clostridia bacterium]
MGVAPQGVGLFLCEGSLSGYSVERLQAEYSNDRGDFILHPDSVMLQPGETLRIAWELFAFPDGKFGETMLNLFEQSFRCAFTQESVFPGESIDLTVTCAKPVSTAKVTLNGKTLPVAIEGEKVRISCLPEKTGEQKFELEINGRHGFARALALPAFEEILQKRVNYILAHQQFLHEGSPLDGAFLIFDRVKKEFFYEQFVNDHNAARERLGMGLFLTAYLQKHSNPQAYQALEKFEQFVLRELFDTETGYVYNTIGKDPAYTRLYNAPWMVTLFEELFYLKHDKIYLNYIHRALRHYYSMGGTKFYPNGSVFAHLPALFRQNGMNAEADELEQFIAKHVETICANGICYPPHEVRYEQTIVTPAAGITGEYALCHPAPEWKEETGKHIEILERFDGTQPDYHLNSLPIRHWDGYWFGKAMQFGDTFPH